MKKVDLNVDIGEGFPHDEQLLAFATSANVCCGIHAGSPELTEETAELCRRKGLRIGAHPGYPDRENMGRKPMPPSQEQEYLDSLLSQYRLTLPILQPAYVKPHGAFYNETGVVLEGSEVGNLPCGQALLEMVEGIGGLMGLPHTAHETFARKAGGKFLAEGFADRAYRADGTLVPRSEPGAVLHDPEEIRAQVFTLAPKVDSICLHGDTPDCLEFAELVYKTLVDAGYEVGY